MLHLTRKITAPACFSLALLFVFVLSCHAQSLSFERDRHRQMLEMLKNDIKKNYYDTDFHGINLETRFETANNRIKQANSIGEMSGIIAQVLADFDDSHLYFLPPGKAARVDYGWEMQMVGDKCFITEVKAESDAESQGLKPGDQVYSLGGYAPNHQTLWKMNYLMNVLRPQPVLAIEIIKPNGTHATLNLKSKITQGKIVKDLAGGADLNNFLRDQEDAYLKERKQFFYDKIGDIFI